MVSNKDDKRSVCIVCGPRESQLLEKKDDLMQEQKLDTISNTEMFKRAAHSWRYSLEVDEQLILELLAELLEMSKDLDGKKVATSKSLAFAAMSAMIAKQGLSKSESFDTVPMNLKALNNYLLTQKVTGDSKKRVSEALSELETSVKTVFLWKHSINADNHLLCR